MSHFISLKIIQMQEQQTFSSTTKDCGQFKETVNSESETVSRLNVSKFFPEPKHSSRIQSKPIHSSGNALCHLGVRYAFKKMKQGYLMESRLRSIVAELLESEINYLSNLDHLKVELQQATSRLITAQVLDEDQCKDLYNLDEKGSNWEVLVHISQQCQKIFTKALTHKQRSNQLLLDLEEVTQSFQVYKEEYLRISKIMATISLAESRLVIKSLDLATDSPQKPNRFTSRESKTCHRVLNSVSDIKIVESEIVDDTEIETEHKQHYQQARMPLNDLGYFQELLGQLGKVRKHIFKPFIKLCEFMQLVTEYLCSYNSLYGQDAQTPGARKLSVLFNKIMCNQYEMLGDEQSEIVKWIMYKFPNLFFGQGDLAPSKLNLSLQQTMEINIEQNLEELSESPLIMSFNTFPIFFMGIPCEVYLLANYLIIVQSNILKPMIGSSSVSASNLKVKSKKLRQVNRLAVVHLDHTTKVEVVSQVPTYSRGFRLYISGGMKSSGVYLEFRAKQINPSDLTKHVSICKGLKSSKLQEAECKICSGAFVSRWQQSSASSNLQIFKLILELTCSYQYFLYACYHRNISIAIPPQFVDQIYGHKTADRTSTGIVKPKPNSQQLPSQHRQQSYSIMGKDSIEAEEIIPSNRLLSATARAVEHFSLNQSPQKSYVIDLQICEPINSSYRSVRNGMRSTVRTKSTRILESVQLSQQQVEQLLDYIFRIFPTMNFQSADSYFNVLKLHQSKQLFLTASASAEETVDIECLTISNLLNTLFKQPSFRSKPELICRKLKMSQGLWKIYVEGVDFEHVRRVHNENFQIYDIGRQINNFCTCFQCCYANEDSQPGLSDGPFWFYYNRLLSTSFNEQQQNSDQLLIMESFKKLSNSKKQQKPEKQKLITTNEKRRSAFVKAIFTFLKNHMKYRRPYCQSFGLRLQTNYYSDLLKKYNSISLERREVNPPGDLIVDFLNKVKCSSYHSKSSSLTNFYPSLLNFIQPTLKLESLNVKLYCLPLIYDYYHCLQPFTEPIQPNIFKEIEEQERGINMQANYGFTSKLVFNIHKDTTCKHLKYIIGQQLGLQKGYIMHFMETFSLAIFERKESVEKSKLQSLFGKLFNPSKKPTVQLRLKELEILYDHQRVCDVLQLLKKNNNCYIGLRKYYKLSQPLLSRIQASQHISKQNKDLMQDYYLSLEYELAEIVYKLNSGLIQVTNDTCQFLTQYIAYLFCYLHIRMKEQKEKFQQKHNLPLDERLLIKTGIFSKHLFQTLYNSSSGRAQTESRNLSMNTNNTDDDRSRRRKSLLQQCRAYIESITSKQVILNKIITLVYECTSWSSDVESVLYIKSKINFIKCFIFISSEGIILRSEQAIIDADKPTVSVMKSVLQSKTSDKFQTVLLEFDYHEIQLQLTGSVLTIIARQQKHKLFALHPYHLLEKISFYQAYSRMSPIDKIECFQSKLKLKFAQEGKRKSRMGLKHLEINSQYYIESEKIRDSKQRDSKEDRKKPSKLEEQFTNHQQNRLIRLQEQFQNN